MENSACVLNEWSLIIWYILVFFEPVLRNNEEGTVKVMVKVSNIPGEIDGNYGWIVSWNYLGELRYKKRCFLKFFVISAGSIFG